MPLKRWLTALALGPLLVALILFGPPWAFLTLACAAVLRCLYEYYRMVSGLSGRTWLWTASGALLPLAFALMQPPQLLALLVVAVIGYFTVFVLKGEVRPPILDLLGKELLGLVYVGLLLSHFVLLYELEDGRFWVLFVMAVAFAEDTGAFYAGRNLGRRKLCPTLSPGKTVEGAVGGLAAAVLAAVVFRWLFLSGLPLPACLTLGLVVGVAGQVGDLFESLIKRASGVKDAGNLLPGHGGLLDRIDSLIFSAPLVYYCKLFWLEAGVR
jgi:phosphatidate cytidylyltransferase